MDPSRPARVISQKYRLERRLGKGGMGEVWVARHLQLDTEVALKLLVDEHMATPLARARFEREARAAAQVKSPHIVQVFDYGVDGETPYLAMELLEGEDLEARIVRAERLSPEETLAIVLPVCKALRRIHEAGLVHRDLKPSNVFLSRHDDEEIVKVLDFGIAKPAVTGPGDVTTSGVVIGSPPYMSPEQILARKQLDHRADLWSLGVIVFRALTGSLPFVSEVVTQLVVEICTAPVPLASSVAPDLPPGLDAFLERALSRDLDVRYQTAAELSAAFSAWVKSAPPGPRALSAPPAKDGVSSASGEGSAPAVTPPARSARADATPNGQPISSDTTLPMELVGEAGEPATGESGKVVVPAEPAGAAELTKAGEGDSGGEKASPGLAPAAQEKDDSEDKAVRGTEKSATSKGDTDGEKASPAPAPAAEEDAEPRSEAVPSDTMSAVREAPGGERARSGRAARSEGSLIPAIVVGGLAAVIVVGLASLVLSRREQASSGQTAGPLLASGPQVASAPVVSGSPVPSGRASAAAGSSQAAGRGSASASVSAAPSSVHGTGLAQPVGDVPVSPPSEVPSAAPVPAVPAPSRDEPAPALAAPPPADAGAAPGTSGKKRDFW